jgi:myo-inositol 2-dehydrogenase / D-chiro-inositol 1-dehydrogenase
MNRRDFLNAAGTMAAGAVVLKGSPGETISVGCIGVGGRGTYHLTNLLKMKNVAAKAICDTNPDHLANAQKLVEAAGQPRPDGFTDWKKLLERKDIDAVVSALPVYLHAQCYLDTVAAGKDIYAEKPLCINWSECDKVVSAVQKSKVIFQVGFQRRADPYFLETISLVHKGELGKLVEGRVAWCNAWGPIGGWFGHAKQSGDWMVEQACHNWDVIVWANQCSPVRAAGFGSAGWFKDREVIVDGVNNTWKVEPDRDVHDYYSGVIEFANGCIVNIIHSWVVPDRFNDEYTRLIGTKGGIDFNAGIVNYREDKWMFEKRPKQKADLKVPVGGKSDSSVLAVEAFLKSVRDRSKPIATVENGRDAVLCCLLMRQAVYTKDIATMEKLKAAQRAS